MRKLLVNLYVSLIRDRVKRHRVREILRPSPPRVFDSDFMAGSREEFIRTGSYRPSVSVVVPCYNHRKWLKQRLDSILSQTYENYEVLLLDDCSTDGSREVLTEYAERYPEKIRCLFNESNSGCVFRQWARGLAECRGDLVWIAESDDWCEKNFLETLVPYFQDTSVMLAFGKSRFIMDDVDVFSMEKYLHDVPYDWDGRFVDSVHSLLNNGFAYKNIIPNVSSAIFRNTGFEQIIHYDPWYDLRVCGDWLFYLIHSMGGMIAYDSAAINYYRQHKHNTSVCAHKEEFFYREHEQIASIIREHFDVDVQKFVKLEEQLNRLWKAHSVNPDNKKFKECFNLYRIAAHERKNMNVLIASYSFSTGGGETLPIHLANALRKAGHVVTFASFDPVVRNAGIRAMLSREIPVVFARGDDWTSLFEKFGIEKCYSGHLSVDYDIALHNKCRHVKHYITLHGMYECMSDDILASQLPLLSLSVAGWFYIADKNLIPFKQQGIETSSFVKVPNGLPLAEASAMSRESLCIEKDALVMCITSRAIPEKGWMEAIEVTRILRREYNVDAHLILCGDGPLYDKLRKTDLPDYIHLMGFQEKCREYISISDYMLLPSYFRGESFPLCILDAIFCRVPVIATDIGEVRNMLTVDGQIFGRIPETTPGVAVSPEVWAAEVVSYERSRSPEEVSRLAEILSARYDIQNVAKIYEREYMRG